MTEPLPDARPGICGLWIALMGAVPLAGITLLYIDISAFFRYTLLC